MHIFGGIVAQIVKNNGYTLHQHLYEFRAKFQHLLGFIDINGRRKRTFFDFRKNRKMHTIELPPVCA